MRGLLHLVDEGDGIILEGDAAAVLVGEELVPAQTEAAGALSRNEHRRGRDGLISRKAFPTVPVTVAYSITPLGQTLTSTLDALRIWPRATSGRSLMRKSATKRLA